MELFDAFKAVMSVLGDAAVADLGAGTASSGRQGSGGDATNDAGAGIPDEITNLYIYEDEKGRC